MADSCLFCRIARGEIPAKVVAQDDVAMAFRDISPQAPTHVLVIPRVHVSTLHEAGDPALLGHLLQMAADVARREGVTDAGYRTVINTNGDGGQTVFHLHVHVLGGRALAWPPG